MGRYDTALAANQQGWRDQLALESPLTRFMASLRQGQGDLAARQQSAFEMEKAQREQDRADKDYQLRELLRGDAQARAAQEAELARSQEARAAGEYANKQSLWPLERRKMEEDMRNQRMMAQASLDRANRPTGAAGGGGGGGAPLVPGSQAWKNVWTARTNLEAAERAASGGLAAMKSLGESLDAVKNSPGLGLYTGRSSVIAPYFQSGKDTEAAVKRLKAMAGMTILQGLKAGGTALGSVTEAEHQLLQDYMANLDAAQSKEQFLEQLGNIDTWIKRNTARVNQYVVNELTPQKAELESYLKGSPGPEAGAPSSPSAPSSLAQRLKAGRRP